MLRAALAAAKLGLLAVPGAGPVVAVLQFLVSPVGLFLVGTSLAFIGGWHAKGKLDEAATARAVIAKQRIDLEAADSALSDSTSVISQLAAKDLEQQERIRDLAKKPGACVADDAAARGLRRIR